MKIKKPEIIPMFKCSSGPPVESLPLWKRAEIAALLATFKGQFTPATTDELVTFLVDHAEAFISILWLKEKGRPNGAKDKKPRKTRVVADDTKAA